MNNVSVIKPILNPSNRLKRVCGYARVSTIDEHQDTSYNTQILELEDLIKLILIMNSLEFLKIEKWN